MTIMAPIYPDADAILPILHIMNLPEDLFASEFSPDFNPNDISPKSRRFYKTNSPGLKMIKLIRTIEKEAFINAEDFQSPKTLNSKKMKRPIFLPSMLSFSQ